MGRPPLPINTFGKILFVRCPGGRVEARAKFRDFDGRVRLVSRVGPSRAAAERFLKAELMRRQAPASGGAIAPSTRLVDLADAWLAGQERSITTDRLYRAVVAKHVRPALGQLRVQEVTAGIVTRALRAMGERSGPSVAKTARTCLSGMFSLAVEDGAVAVNPVRDSSARMSVERRAPRALTPAQTGELRALSAASDRARELDVCDLVDWMLATNLEAVRLLDLPADTDAYVCGPVGFMAAMSSSLPGARVDPDHIHTETFGASAASGAVPVRAHPPADGPGTGPTVTFARSGLAVPFSDDYANLLEFAEACDVPVRWSCRTGVCHTCVTPLVATSVRYCPEPLQPPDAGEVLLCCAVPDLDTVLDA